MPAQARLQCISVAEATAGESRCIAVRPGKGAIVTCLSILQDLHHDAERDLKALGCHITVINNCQTLDKETRVSGLAKDMQEGVLFM